MPNNPILNALIADLEAYRNEETPPSVNKVREWHEKLLLIRCGLMAHIYRPIQETDIMDAGGF